MVEVKLLFTDLNVGFDVEEVGYDGYMICLTDYQINEEKSTEVQDVVEPRSVTEVYLDKEEIQSIINTLEFMVKQSEEK